MKRTILDLEHCVDLDLDQDLGANLELDLDPSKRLPIGHLFAAHEPSQALYPVEESEATVVEAPLFLASRDWL